jgi:hypothetical protein
MRVSSTPILDRYLQRFQHFSSDGRANPTQASRQRVTTAPASYYMI